MATTTNYGWTTPDDTALVKDGASAIRTLGSSVDTTTKNLNPSTTLGDVEYRSSTANTNTRLGIGTTGQVLTVSGGVPTWASPSGGGDVWTLLNAGGTTLTGAATVTVSGISGKEKLFIIIEGASTDATAPGIGVRFNTDTGSNYYQYGSGILATTSYSSADLVRTITGADNYATFGIGNSTSTASTINGYCLLTGCSSSTSIKMFQINGGASSNGYAYQFNFHTGGYYNSNTAITSVSAFSTSGSFDAGKIYIYANS